MTEYQESIFEEIQQYVIASMLLDVDCLKEGMRKLLPEMFTRYQISVFRMMKHMWDSGVQIDMISLAWKLSEKQTDINDHVIRISDMTTRIASTAHFQTHCMFIFEEWAKWKMSMAGEDLKQKIENGNDVFEVMAVKDERIEEIQQRIKFFKNESAKLHELGKVRKGIELYGMLWMPGDLIIIAGRPGQGKSAFAISIIMNGLKAAYFSLEMDGLSLYARLNSIISHIPTLRILSGNIYQNEQETFDSAQAELTDRKFYIEDGIFELADIKRRAAELVLNEGVKAIFIDYLQIIRGPKQHSREREVGFISMELKRLAKELQIPVVVLAQLNRDVEKRAGNAPRLADLRESGQIEQDADIIGFLYRPEFYSEKEFYIGEQLYTDVEDKAVFICDKYRNSSPYRRVMNFEKKRMYFSELRHEQVF